MNPLSTALSREAETGVPAKIERGLFDYIVITEPEPPPKKAARERARETELPALAGAR